MNILKIRNVKKPIMKLLFLLAFIAFFFSICTTKNPEVRCEVLFLVWKISKKNILMDEAVGFFARRPWQWDRFIKLQNKATDNELVVLTKHENAVVRCYAFQALAMRNNEKYFEILKEHLTDNDSVEFFSGCFRGKKLVSDHFLYCVSDHFDENLHLLTDQQKIELDSILLYNDSIKSYHKDEFLKRVKPEPAYYERIREIVVKEGNLTALVALAKYQNPNDIPIIKKYLVKKNKVLEFSQYWAIYAVREYPDKAFYDDLQKIFEQNWKEEYYDYSIWKILYQALAKYPTDETIKLFERTVTEGDEFKKNTLGTYLMIAIMKYPHERYELIKKEIEIDDFHLREVEEQMNIEK